MKYARMILLGWPKFAATDCQIEALIIKGGSVALGYKEAGRTKPRPVQLRLPEHFVQRIDHARKPRLVAQSRHAWLFDALLAKLAAKEYQGP